MLNNCGIGAQGTVETNDDEESRRIFDVNVVGMVRVAGAALEHQRLSEHAVVVNTCSVVAVSGPDGDPLQRDQGAGLGHD